MKLLINNTEGTEVLKQLFSERHTAGKCRQIISWRSLTQQTLFISVHKCKSYSQRTQQAAVTHGHWIMEMGFTDWNSTLFQFFNFLNMSSFFPLMTLHLIPTSVRWLRLSEHLYYVHYARSHYVDRQLALIGPMLIEESPQRHPGVTALIKSLTNKWEKNIMNIQTSSVKLIVLMKPSQINSKFYSHHILILIL